MRTRSSFRLILAPCFLVGCGPALPPPPSAPASAPAAGPHGGMAVALPEEQGYVEFVNEPAVEERSSTVSTALVAYFLAKDVKTALPSPTDVTFRLDQATGGSRKLAMKADPKAGDPAGSARFASDLGPFRVSDLRGELAAKIGDKPVSVQLAGSR